MLSKDVLLTAITAKNKKNVYKLVEADSKEAEFYKFKKEHQYEKCCEPKHCRPEKSNFVCTLISVKNPDTELVIPVVLPGVAQQQLAVVGEAVDLAKWTDIVPDALGIFDNLTGTFTAPESGDYQIELTVNFKTSVPLPVSLNLVDVPIVEVYDIDSGNHILSSFLPTVSLIVPVPPQSSGEVGVDVPVASILGAGQVIINAIVPLIAGQRIRIRAVTNGLIYPFIGVIPSIDFSPAGVDTTLAIYKYRNSPIVTINCNN